MPGTAGGTSVSLHLDFKKPKQVDEAIAANAKSVADYKGGKEAALKALIGQVMKLSKGKANPGLVNDLLKRKLS